MKIIIYTLLLFIGNYISSFAEWKYQNSNLNDSLYRVKFLNNNIGFIGTSEGKILITSNGGINWEVKLNEPNFMVYKIYFLNNKQGWGLLVSKDLKTKIFGTTDCGLNWSELSNNQFLVLTSIYFFDENYGFAVGRNINGSVFMVTSNSGITWENKNTGYPTQIYYNIEFSDTNNGWIIGSKGTIIKTTNRGINWTKQNSNSLSDLYYLSVLDSNNCYISGNGSTILKTSDGGINWISIKGNLNLLDDDLNICFIDTTHGLLVGSNNNTGIIWKTEDGGINWIVDFEKDGYQFYDISIIDKNYAWVVGTHGTILYRDDLFLTTIESIDKSNYHILLHPSPFSTSFNIEFTNSTFTSFSVIIYNILGKEVYSKNYGMINEDNHTFYIQPNIQSGFYILKIEIGGVVICEKLIKTD